jgi:hypothetical protein
MAFFYWLVTATLLILGILGWFSFGLPLFALGFTLAVLAGARRLPHIFWPPIVGVILFFATYILLAPLGCSTTETPVEVAGPGDIEPTTTLSEQRVTCDRLVLPDTAGTETPSLWPAALAAVAVAFGGANVARLGILRRAWRPRQRTSEPVDTERRVR